MGNQLKGKMMKRIALLILLIISYSSEAWAVSWPKDFSADVVTTAGGQQMAGKVYISKEKSRFEMMGMVTIARMDKNVVYMLMPEQRMYMEQPVDPKAVAQAGAGEEVSRKSLGS